VNSLIMKTCKRQKPYLTCLKRFPNKIDKNTDTKTLHSPAAHTCMGPAGNVPTSIPK